MTTLEIVKSKIASLDRRVNTLECIEAAMPIMKRQRVNEKMTYILQNPETFKWTAIRDEQVNELNDMYNIAKTGVSVNDDDFLFKA